MSAIENILDLVNEKRGFDFSGYRNAMLERRIQKRLMTSKLENHDEYFKYLSDNDDEMDSLIDAFTINVSSFFRDPIIFEFIARFILHELVDSKKEEGTNNLRIWSAGCSRGEEAYSLAILVSEHFKKENPGLKTDIFATDIDGKAIKSAKSGLYNTNCIKNVKHGILKEYFTENNGLYKISNSIMKTVRFSTFDILDKKHINPPDSIFGGFDMILCRNLLIYLKPNYQSVIFQKLYKSLNKNGFLVLGEAETPIDEFKLKFKRANNYCKIYRKIG